MKKLSMQITGLVVIALISIWLSFKIGILYIVGHDEVMVQTRSGNVSHVITDNKFRIWAGIAKIHQQYWFSSQRQIQEIPQQLFISRDDKSFNLKSFFTWTVKKPKNLFEQFTDNQELGNKVSEKVTRALQYQFRRFPLAERFKHDSTRKSPDLGFLLDKAVASVNPELLENLGVQVESIHMQKLQLVERSDLHLKDQIDREKKRQAKKIRAFGREDSIRIVAEADRKIVELDAESYQMSQKLMGEGEAKAAAVYSQAFEKDAEFYAFWRSLETYKRTMDTTTTLVISPKSELYKYLAQKP